MGVIGNITGTNKAANAQVDAANQANQLQKQMYDDQVNRLNPYMDTGTGALTGLNGLVNNRGQTLQNYYNSDEYKQMANQAQYQQLAAAEATGGLGSSATSNQLASIAPQLGQNYLNTQYSQLMGLAGLGMGAAGMMGNSGTNYANAYNQNMNQIGAVRAGQATAPFNTLAGIGGTLAGLY